jgi:3-oxoadipate enol-lactonase
VTGAAPHQVQWIEVEPNIGLAVDAARPSDKPVVVLSNSIGASFEMWDEFAARAGRRLRLIRYDTRGHGRSSVPSGPYTIDRLGRDVIAILDALNVERAVVCGLSLGGLTGLWLGAACPERLNGLILANTAANFPPPGLWRERAAAVRADGTAPLVDATLDRWFTKTFQARQPERVAEIGRMIAATPPEGYAACCEVLAATDLRPHLAAIRCPVHVICGQQDPSTPPSRGEECVASITGATMVTLDAAHISAVEAADQFAETAIEFVTHITRRQ